MLEIEHMFDIEKMTEGTSMKDVTPPNTHTEPPPLPCLACVGQAVFEAAGGRTEQAATLIDALVAPPKAASGDE